MLAWGFFTSHDISPWDNGDGTGPILKIGKRPTNYTQFQKVRESPG